MANEKPIWRQVFDTAERPVTPRVEALVRTPEFSNAAVVAARVQTAARARVAALTTRGWHAFNLPAGTDIVRLRSQLAVIDRELRRLSMRVEHQDLRQDSRSGREANLSPGGGDDP